MKSIKSKKKFKNSFDFFVNNYGLSKEEIKFAMEKIKNQKKFLDKNFVNIGGKDIKLSEFTKNSFLNSDRYIAEINNRVNSLVNYAKNRNLVNIFITLTLPTEFHPTLLINEKSGKRILNKKYINDEEHNPKNGSKVLSKMFKSIMDSRVFKSIGKEDRCYFRVTEPHKDGTPHLHISLFVPQDKVQKLKDTIYNLFPKPAADIEVEIRNPVAYLMKYILKTLDDLRENPDNLSSLTLWYIRWGICRLYTSRTLVSLEIYRTFSGSETLLGLTQMIKDKEITAWYDKYNGQLEFITRVNDNFGSITIWQKKPILFQKTPCRVKRKFISKKKFNNTVFVPVYVNDTLTHVYNSISKKTTKIIKKPYQMTNIQLYRYYLSMKNSEDTVLKRVTYNECIKRGLIDGQILSLNIYERI